MITILVDHNVEGQAMLLLGVLGTAKFQSGFPPQEPFHLIGAAWAKKVDEMLGGRLKIDLLPGGAMVPPFQVLDAIHTGTLDGGFGVPAYWFGKQVAFSLFGTGPSWGLDAEQMLGLIYHGGGQQLYDELVQKKLKLEVQSFFLAPMPTQPLGWFKQGEIQKPEDLKGIKYRTVGLSADLFNISWVRFLEACFGFCSGVMVAGMSDYRHKRHNVSSLLYHIVCPAKYRRVIFDPEVDTVLRDICFDIAQRYEIAFVGIGTEKDHVHFLVQSVPSYSPTKVVQMIKSLTAREIFHRVLTVKKRLWGGKFWSKGYFISTVGRHGNEEVIREYVRQQGSEKAYTQLHRQDVQLGLF